MDFYKDTSFYYSVMMFEDIYFYYKNHRLQKETKLVTLYLYILICSHGRQTHIRTAPLLYVAYTQQGHEARNDSAKISLRTGLSLPSALQTAAGQPRYCAAQIPHSGICERLLLAWPQRLQIFRTSKNEYRILETEDRAQCSARQSGQSRTSRSRLARHTVLGMYAQAQSQRRQSEGTGAHSSPHYAHQLRS